MRRAACRVSGPRAATSTASCAGASTHMKRRFAPLERTVGDTGMEHCRARPLGLPPGWPVLVDAAVLDAPQVVVGSGLRLSELVLPGADAGHRPDAEVLPRSAGAAARRRRPGRTPPDAGAAAGRWNGSTSAGAGRSRCPVSVARLVVPDDHARRTGS